MKRLVEKIRKYESLMGDGIKKPQSCENSIKLAVRRSIAASENLEGGEEGKGFHHVMA